MKRCLFFSPLKPILFIALFISANAWSYGQAKEELEKMNKKELSEKLQSKLAIIDKLNKDINSCEEIKSNLEKCKQENSRLKSVEEELNNLKNYEKLNGVYWTKTSSKITRFKSGNEIKEARGVKEWNALTADSVACYMEPPYKESEEQGYLYNYYAVQKINEWQNTEGFRLPTVKEAEQLIEYLKSVTKDAPNAGVLLRMPDGLNIKSGGYCSQDNDWDAKKTIFWLSPNPENSGASNVYGLSIGSDNSVGIFERSANTYGFMVRLVKK